jgi:hypothetical protein
MFGFTFEYKSIFTLNNLDWLVIQKGKKKICVRISKYKICFQFSFENADR